MSRSPHVELIRADNFPADEFKELVSHGGDISELSSEEFDSRGDYGEVIEAVKKAGSGAVKVFRIHHGKTRAEYYIISVDSKGHKIVGLRARAVET